MRVAVLRGDLQQFVIAGIAIFGLEKSISPFAETVARDRS